MRKGYKPLFENESSHLLPETTRRFGRTYIGSKVDHLSDNETEDETVEFEMSDVRSRTSDVKRKQKAFQNSFFIEKEIGKSDTLLTLSFQYRCPVAEIKRINHLFQDQEFYALKTIKIPVKKHSVLSELNSLGTKQQDSRTGQNVVSNGRASSLTDDVLGMPSTDISQSVPSTSHDDDTQTLVRTLSISELCKSDSPSPTSFLLQMDQDLEKVRKATSSLQSFEQTTSSLTEKRFHPMRDDALLPRRKSGNGATGGIPWWCALLLAIIITVCIPLFYFVYLEYIKPSVHSGTSAPNTVHSKNHPGLAPSHQ